MSRRIPEIRAVLEVFRKSYETGDNANNTNAFNSMEGARVRYSLLCCLKESYYTMDHKMNGTHIGYRHC